MGKLAPGAAVPPACIREQRHKRVANNALLGTARANSLARRATPLNQDPWPSLMVQLASETRLARNVRLLKHNKLSVPFTCGFVRPLIVLPGVAESWSAERLRVVLLHELAHIRRNDWLALHQPA